MTDNHGCEDCGEINRGYVEVDNGKKICKLCGGTVLSQQEAFDRILELKSELRYITGSEGC